jgi:hypothetical protein
MLFNGNNLGEIETLVRAVNTHIGYPSPISYFKVLKYDGNTLTICGSSDPSLHHEVEIKFKDVFHFSGDLDWARNLHKTFLYIADFHDDEYSHGRNARLKFTIQTDDFYYHNRENKIVVWARGITYNTEKITYSHLNDASQAINIPGTNQF